MVTHDPVAASYCDRVVFLADGRVVEELRHPDREKILATMSYLQDVALARAGQLEVTVGEAVGDD
jgi:putative ABC transport system ATP-binding protein